MDKKLRLFDYDGTLVNSVAFVPSVHAQILTEMGMPVDADFIRAGLGEIDPVLVNRAYRYVHKNTPDETVCAELTARFRALQREKFQNAYTQLRPRIPEPLRVFLRNSSTLNCVASNGLSHQNAKLLQELEVADIFPPDRVYGPDRVDGNGKPKPDMLLRACADHGIAPQDAVMVGDTLADMLAAQAAGIDGILFSAYAVHTDTPAFEHALSAATHHAQDMEALLRLLK